MKILALLSIISFSFLQAGFDGSTLVTTASGRLKPITELRVGDEVMCHNSSLDQEINRVKAVLSFEVDEVMHVTTQDNITIVASLTQRFFLPLESAWVCAFDLKQGDKLLNDDLEYKEITSVSRHTGRQTVSIINVDGIHNFVASAGRYIVHNGAIGASVGAAAGYWGTTVAFNAFYSTVGTLSSAVVGPVAGGTIGLTVRGACMPIQVAATKSATLFCGMWGAIFTGPL